MTHEDLLKVVWVCRYQPSWDRERAQRYWRTHHAGMGRRVPSMPLYLQNHLVEAVGPREVAPDRPLGVDGFSVCWFDGEEGFRRCIESPEMQEMDEDATRVFDVDDILGGWSARLDETVTERVDTPEEELFKVGWIGRYGRGAIATRRTALDRGHRELLDAVPGLCATRRTTPWRRSVRTASRPSSARVRRDRRVLVPDRVLPRRDVLVGVAGRLEDADGLFDLGPMWDGGYAGVVDHLWINWR